ncbi:glutaminyl-peptide cyclotransferase [Nocardia terpenica]|uniref:glutaminyl-peptide cyclotransferase n=1 Tax=Nocardia terpenica TaxID=455432 RepID=UPI001894890E|nr:glutaminyl-peptide cyclotransferase [Nocardia terpenica]MBF6062211.1 glutaminyl-peptide cyclotransferase [Nocardia terpenica]MBF6104299.1 glutaminyl-peptide cyclotransferase [Nocardia terpenica]MBF6109845.1 glutaminyl-peptide cyclotransferase [Nocardia terpenica]MBF6120151.1 glutaminyl-peptide cyclotransferase [Nocardia terpenica]MBF6152562.1 glutaminyl-peptide cyclotransferase [Nocardia terpenica]
MESERRAWAVRGLILLAGAVLAAAGAAAVTGCDRRDDTPRERVEVIGARPHDRAAFTEGLEVDGTVLYEGTGLVGESFVRATELATGAQLARVDLPAPLFGEGIARAGDILWELTWKDGTAIARDPRTLAERGRASYRGEGWGLCTRGARLVMSNGTDTLTFRDPVTFAPTGSVRLTSHHGARLNELDCAADGSVYANVWPTDHILRIDPDTGAVRADIDASGLLTPAERAGTDVLNGIAELPGTDHFLITGKNWPTMFEVRFVPA